MTHQIIANSLAETLQIGTTIGQKLRGGEVIELISDLGGGKTSFVKGLAVGIDTPDQVASPTFTILRIYKGREVELHHFDFYRLSAPGVVADELAESVADPKTAVVIEWGEVVQDVLPPGRLKVKITVTGENSRQFQMEATDARHARLLEGIR